MKKIFLEIKFFMKKNFLKIFFLIIIFDDLKLAIDEKFDFGVFILAASGEGSRFLVICKFFFAKKIMYKNWDKRFFRLRVIQDFYKLLIKLVYLYTAIILIEFKYLG